jgi:hypothetical protein
MVRVDVNKNPVLDTEVAPHVKRLVVILDHEERGGARTAGGIDQI